MCTKFFADGDVHKYFNPYNTPYEAFINFMNILTDFSLRVKAKYAELQLLPPPAKPKRTKSAKKV
jgi:alpha-amylase